MDKIVIYYALRHLGYRFTELFLEEGYEVISVQDEERSREDDDRGLAIGRNANFTEQSSKSLSSILEKSTSILYVLNYLDDPSQIDTPTNFSPKQGDRIITLLPMEQYRCARSEEVYSAKSYTYYLPVTVKDQEANEQQSLIQVILELAKINV